MQGKRQCNPRRVVSTCYTRCRSVVCPTPSQPGVLFRWLLIIASMITMIINSTFNNTSRMRSLTVASRPRP